MVMSPQEQKVTAWHEAGHTLVGNLVEGNDPVHKVSIIPRGAALGVTQMLPVEDRHTMTERQALARIAMMLGGRVAEELVFGDVTTGAADDIKRATRLAHAMVCEYGMSQKLGPLAYGENEDSVFLGRDMTQRRQDYSDETAREIDKEVRQLIDTQYQLVRETIEANREKLDRLARALLERETLDSEEIRACMDDTELPERQRVVIPTWSQRRQKDEKKRGPIFTGQPKPAGGEV
jgi:cell division protease FtsH